MSKPAFSSLCGGLLLSLMTTVVAEPTARADEYQEHLERSEHLGQEQNYREALKELQAAYALKQSPPLFLAMARLQVQLGEGREALDSYRRYQVARPVSEPAVQQETDGAIARLAALYDPPHGPPPVPAASPGLTVTQLDALISSRLGYSETARLKKRNTSLMVGGSILFGMGYAAAFLSGTFLLAGNSCVSSNYNYTNYGSKNIPCTAANSLLLVPIVGPVVGGLLQPSAYWTVPWIFVDGAAQIGGLAMMIVAARSNHALASKGQLAKLQLLPYANPRESGLTLAGRF